MKRKNKTNQKQISYLDKFNIKCDPSCIYYPNAGCESGDWVYDESKFCNVRKEPKILKCLYDNQPIDWYRECPREADRSSL